MDTLFNRTKKRSINTPTISQPSNSSLSPSTLNRLNELPPRLSLALDNLLDQEGSDDFVGDLPHSDPIHSSKNNSQRLSLALGNLGSQQQQQQNNYYNSSSTSPSTSTAPVTNGYTTPTPTQSNSNPLSNAATSIQISSPINLIPTILPTSSHQQPVNRQNSYSSSGRPTSNGTSNSNAEASSSRIRSGDEQSIRSVQTNHSSNRIPSTSIATEEMNRRSRIDSFHNNNDRNNNERNGYSNSRNSDASSYAGSTPGGPDYKPLPKSPHSITGSNLTSSVSNGGLGGGRTSTASYNNSSINSTTTSSSYPSFSNSNMSSRASSSTIGSSHTGSMLPPRRTSIQSQQTQPSNTYSPRPSTINSFDNNSNYETSSLRSSTHTVSSISQLPTPSPHSTEFDFPKPSSNEIINALFEEILPKLCSNPKALRDMRALDPAKKWIMVYNESFLKWKARREKLTSKPLEVGGGNRSAPAVGTSLLVGGGAISSPNLGSGGGEGSGRTGGIVERSAGKARGKNESPEWYVARVMDGTITTGNYASLSVSLRTYELE